MGTANSSIMAEDKSATPSASTPEASNSFTFSSIPPALHAWIPLISTMIALLLSWLYSHSRPNRRSSLKSTRRNRGSPFEGTDLNPEAEMLKEMAASGRQRQDQSLDSPNNGFYAPAHSTHIPTTPMSDTAGSPQDNAGQPKLGAKEQIALRQYLSGIALQDAIVEFLSAHEITAEVLQQLQPTEVQSLTTRLKMSATRQTVLLNFLQAHSSPPLQREASAKSPRKSPMTSVAEDTEQREQMESPPLSSPPRVTKTPTKKRSPRHSPQRRASPPSGNKKADHLKDFHAEYGSFIRRNRMERAGSLTSVVVPLGTEPTDTDTDQDGMRACRVYNWSKSQVTGFLIDLDGTMYKPGELLPGAVAFHQWLLETGKQFVFLSNTGAKGSEGVQAKFMSDDYKLHKKPVPLDHIYTAAQAQIEYLVDKVPEGAKMFVISGCGEGFWLPHLQNRNPELVGTWDIRTTLKDSEAKEWATIAAANQANPVVFVVFFLDGTVGGTVDPKTGEPGFADWSFDVIKKTGYLLSHGAQFVYTADDAFNPSTDPEYPGYVFPLPGPGMFADMMRKIMYPQGRNKLNCCGKGGNRGETYMMEKAIEMLKAQGHSGHKEQIMMIGDRFDTDIRGGISVGIKTCLVESGCHMHEFQEFYPDDVCSFVVPDLQSLFPKSTNLRDTFLIQRSNSVHRIINSPAQGLQIWMLAHSNLVVGTHRHQQGPLTPHLQIYFNSVATTDISPSRLSKTPSGGPSPVDRPEPVSVGSLKSMGSSFSRSSTEEHNKLVNAREVIEALRIMGVQITLSGLQEKMELLQGEPVDLSKTEEFINFLQFSALVEDQLRLSGVDCSTGISTKRSSETRGRSSLLHPVALKRHHTVSTTAPSIRGASPIVGKGKLGISGIIYGSNNDLSSLDLHT